MKADRRQAGVPGLLEAKNGLHSKIFGGESRALPVGLFDAPGIDQVDFSNSHRCRRRDDPIQHLGAGKRKNQPQRKRSWRIGIQLNRHFEDIRIKMFNGSSSHPAIHETDAKRIPGGAAKNLPDVPKPSAFKTHTALTDKIPGFKKKVIQGVI